MNSRLDGSTKPEARIQIMERFNRDPRIFCMILSTRSGGVGVNLTGADTVIFYDSDWNPTIDAQAQDRAHRIGQTRDVHIYRFIAKNTIEENILKKADQKRHLGHLAIEEGNFNIDGLKEEQLRTIVEVRTVQACKFYSLLSSNRENMPTCSPVLKTKPIRTPPKILLTRWARMRRSLLVSVPKSIATQITSYTQNPTSLTRKACVLS